jgi:hypothetical protein
MKTHRDRLESELALLRSRRTGIRRELDLMARGHRFIGGDDHDQLVRKRYLEQQLAGTEFRWQEVHGLLGRNPPGPAVRL